VEVLFPVQEQNIIKHLRKDVLETYLIGNQKVRLMQSDGSYTRVKAGPKDPVINPQQWLISHR
jgi:polyphosphate kinase